MSLAGILAVCLLVSQPVQSCALIRSLPSNQESAPPPGAPEKDEPAQTTPTGSPAAPSESASSEAEKQQSSQSPAEPTTQPQQTPEKPATPSAGKKSAHKKKPTLGPSRRVVHNGSTADPTVQLAPGVSQKQASTQAQKTTELLASTEANLKTISGRQLNPSQQDVVSQIRKYMEQSKQAADEGDSQRAHNLAVKAHLLSDDLVKH
jgi:hypothetical protein